MAAQCGISGSVKIGADVQIGGQVGIAQHVTIGDGAVLTARSGVTRMWCHTPKWLAFQRLRLASIGASGPPCGAYQNHLGHPGTT